MRVMIKDHDVGSIALVLSDSTIQCVTHVVIRRGLLGSHRLIVPMDRVVDATLERIVLDLRPDELAALPEYRTDDEITVDVERAIGDDQIVRHLSARHLNIAVHNGVVTVTGNIASSTHRQRVEDSIRRVRGVRSLQNLPIGDDEVEVAVAQALGRDPRTGRFIILVSATLGIVRLSGDVPAVAIDRARAVLGVREVRTAEPLRPG
jgi:osmotically-inducible protein OsmY